VAFVFVLITQPTLNAAPPLSRCLEQLPWLVPVIVIAAMSGVYAAMWGTPKLSPGIVGLLFMTEISVGAVTAALWSGDPFGWPEIVGISLITAAGLLESVRDLAFALKIRSHPIR